MSALLDGLKALGPARLGAMGVVALGVLGLLAVMALHGGASHMALLYADLDLREAGQITEQLGKQHIAYEIGNQGHEILVGAEDVSRARLMLAQTGLPSGGSIGYEIFDRGDGLTATAFQQHIEETRAMEGELARTIRSISGVSAARVHLVLPRREPFSRTREPAQASVLITMLGARRLDRDGVAAIVTLVAAAVPGLQPAGVAVIDSHGTMLARAGEAVGPDGAAPHGDEPRRAMELRLSRAVEQMLERSVGAGRVQAEASVDMDFSRVNETMEKYDPDGQVVRSQQTTTDKSKTTEAATTVSVQNNLPNASAGAAPSGTETGKDVETTNYEIGRTVRTLVQDQPQIKRISLAVMVDGITAKGPDGKPVWTPRPAAELAQMTDLVKTAVGFDAKRGDQVVVQSMRLAATDDGGTGAEPRGLLGLGLERADLMRLAQTGVLGLIAVVALLLVLRPMVSRLTMMPGMLAGSGADAAGLQPPAPQGPALQGPAALGALLGPGGAPALAGAGAVPLLRDESMVSIAQVEGQMRASSVRGIAELADKHPDETLSIVRGWLHAEPA